MISGYDALAEFLKGETDPPKDREHMRLIKFFVEDISNSIDVEALYPCLVQGNWLGRFSSHPKTACSDD